MPPKTKNPASFVKLSPQNMSTEQNKPRKQAKVKHTAIPSVELVSSTQDSSFEPNEKTAIRSLPSIYVHEKKFDLVVDGVAYHVHSISFLWNDNICFRVYINGNEAYVFSWDEEAGRLRTIDDDASILPAGLESALNEKLRLE